MNLVLQDGFPKCCLHACFAMIAGVTLDEIIQLAPSMPMSWDDRIKLLNHFGLVIPGNRIIPMEVYGNDTPSCLVRRYHTMIITVLDWLDVGYAHAVLYHHKTIYDPLLGINPRYPWHHRMSMATPIVRKGNHDRS